MGDFDALSGAPTIPVFHREITGVRGLKAD
jgi:hypothetical protein